MTTNIRVSQDQLWTKKTLKLYVNSWKELLGIQHCKDLINEGKENLNYRKCIVSEKAKSDKIALGEVKSEDNWNLTEYLEHVVSCNDRQICSFLKCRMLIMLKDKFVFQIKLKLISKCRKIFISFILKY